MGIPPSAWPLEMGNPEGVTCISPKFNLGLKMNGTGQSTNGAICIFPGRFNIDHACPKKEGRLHSWNPYPDGKPRIEFWPAYGRQGGYTGYAFGMGIADNSKKDLIDKKFRIFPIERSDQNIGIHHNSWPLTPAHFPLSLS